MKFISPLLGSASGKLGGAVAATSRGGIQYFRKLVIPTNPNTLLQTAIRSAVQSASAIWQNTLTELQQDGWFELAEGSQTGKTLFAKVNQPRIYASNSGRVTDDAGAATTFVPAYFADAPSGGINVAFTNPNTPVIDDSSNTLDMGTVPGGLWNTDVDATNKAAVLVFLSGPQNASRSARQRPYQLVRAYAIEDPGDIDLSPINLATLGIPTVTGKVFYVRSYAQDLQGRTSLAQEWRVTAQA